MGSSLSCVFHVVGGEDGGPDGVAGDPGEAQEVDCDAGPESLLVEVGEGSGDAAVGDLFADGVCDLASGGWGAW
jgi:hypothetical protein